MWDAFSVTAKAFMTAKEKHAQEVAQAREFFKEFLTDANGDEMEAYKNMRKALRQTMPKRLTDAMIAEIGDDESLEDVQKREAARMRKIIERFCNLIRDGKKQVSPSRAGMSAIKAANGGVVPTAVVAANQESNGKPEEYRHASLDKVLKSAISTAAHGVRLLNATKRDIPHDAPQLLAMVELSAFAVDILDGKVSEDKADDTLRMIISKFQPK